MRKVITLIGLTLVIFQMPSAFPQVTPIDFIEPLRLDMKAPLYPISAAQSGAEGWVHITTMIDTEGKPFETYVVDSTYQRGRAKESFERAGLRAMRDSTFIPAQLNGKPTESSFQFIYRFQFEDSDAGITSNFRRIQRNFEEALAENSKEKAFAAIAKIDDFTVLSLAEYALSQMNRFQYSKAFFGDTIVEGKPQINRQDVHAVYLNNALRSIGNDNMDKGGGIATFPEEVTQYLRLSLLATNIERSHYTEAEEIAEILRDSGADMSAYEDALKQINEIKSDESQYSIFGNTDSTGRWSIPLHKNSFFIDNLGNLLQEIKLYCQTKYQYFTFSEGASYTIPDSWGECDLVIIGEGNAEFELIQYKG